MPEQSPVNRCRYCRAPIPDRRRYCHDARCKARARHWATYRRICGWCGEAFLAVRPEAKHCNPRCRWAHTGHRLKARRTQLARERRHARTVLANEPHRDALGRFTKASAPQVRAQPADARAEAPA